MYSLKSSFVWRSALAHPILAILGFASFALTIPGGCGYHTAGSAVHLPKSVHSLAVPTFVNATLSYHTEVEFTQAVIREFTRRTPYTIVSGADAADAVVSGTITKFDVVPLTYNSQTGQSSSYLITISARVSVTDRDHRVLYQNDHYSFRQQYETTQDLTSFIQEDPAAVRRLSRDFAQSLVSDILDSF
jgi:outer membrane lipopolysaccharide assembly protein LptE/RlpB